MTIFKRHPAWLLAFALCMLIVGGYQALFSPPADFPRQGIVIIAQGSPAPLVAEQLSATHIVAHPFVLRLLLRVAGKSASLQAGRYRFSTPEDVFTVIRRLTTGDYGFPPVRLTFVEGTTVREMATQVGAAFTDISAEDFLVAARPDEGYLFPDTYFFPSSSDAASLVNVMRMNFNAKIAPLSDDFIASGHSLADIVTMASLLEKEARTSVNRRIIAGILYNRLARGMPLQVDAVFGYIYGRDTYSPSYRDLTVQSPYNTYTHTGLPPGPIDNPGLDAILAALHPTKTDYFYYLTDRNGVMHYATTYAQHQANEKKYLH